MNWFNTLIYFLTKYLNKNLKTLMKHYSVNTKIRCSSVNKRTIKIWVRRPVDSGLRYSKINMFLIAKKKSWRSSQLSLFNSLRSTYFSIIVMLICFFMWTLEDWRCIWLMETANKKIISSENKESISKM